MEDDIFITNANIAKAYSVEVRIFERCGLMDFHNESICYGNMGYFIAQKCGELCVIGFFLFNFFHLFNAFSAINVYDGSSFE